MPDMGTADTGASAAALPPITVGKMEDAAALIERLVSENTSIFAANVAEYRETRRQSSERPLSAAEAGQVAAAMVSVLDESGVTHGLTENPGETLKGIQDSGLRAMDEPSVQEVLLAAGLATAPALLGAVSRLVALVELDNGEHEKHAEAGTLDEHLDECARTMRTASLLDGRARAKAALDHFQDAAGAAPGEAWSLVVRAIGQAMGQAVAISPELGSAFSSLTGSLAPTDGDDGTSSTTSPTPTP